MAETKRRKSRKQKVETIAGQEVEVDNKKISGRPESVIEDKKVADKIEKEEAKETSYIYRDTKGKLNKKIFKVFRTPRGTHTRLDRIEKNISQKEAMK